MNTDEIIKIIDEHLQEVNENQEERLKRIDEMLFFLNFNKKLTELSPEEKQDYVYSNKGYPLNDEQRETLNKCKTSDEKEYYYKFWARSTYFRLCAWNTYLTGETNEKPIVLELQPG